MTTTKYTMQFRRKRIGKTNYRKRLGLLKSESKRVIVRKSNRNIIMQVVDYHENGDKVLVAADSKELKRFGWNVGASNLPAAYLTGLLLAKKAIAKGVKDGIADIGLQRSTKGSRIYAALKGLADGGFKIPLSEEIVPPEDRYNGKHIEQYAKMLEKDKKKYEMYFSQYLKMNVKPTEISKLFIKTKDHISKGA
jgi:large subunit ribosomal protein L18